jgi:hypothetical protein
MITKGRGYFLQCLVAGFLFFTFHAQAQPTGYVSVYDDWIDGYFSPDPVNIVVGESVYWNDGGAGLTITSYTDDFPPVPMPGEITFLDEGSYIYLDDYDNLGTVNVTANIPPTVTITSPTNQMTFASSATFNFSADANDPGADGLYGVYLFVGQTLEGQLTTAPFTTPITGLAPGTYTLTAIAFNNSTATATNQITITIVSGGTPQPITVAAPQLVAGTFQFDASGLAVGKTNMVEMTGDPSLANWVAVVTNVAASSTMTFSIPATNSAAFFQVVQLP